MSVSLYENSKDCRRIFMKLLRGAECVTSKKGLDIGGDPMRIHTILTDFFTSAAWSIERSLLLIIIIIIIITRICAAEMAV